METQRFGFPSVVALEENGACSIIRCVNLQFEGFFRVRVGQDGFGSEDVYNTVEGVSACGGPMEWCVFLEQIRKWFDYMGETRNECSMIV